MKLKIGLWITAAAGFLLLLSSCMRDAGSMVVSDVNNYLTSILTGSDGLMASVYDYYLFIKGLMDGRLLSTESFIEMTAWRDTY